MNPSSSKIQHLELLSNGLNEQGSVRQWTMAEGESAIDTLPNEVLLTIFRFLSIDQLSIAEQVCLRWKSIVNTCFATTRRLELKGLESYDALMRMKRYGPSLKILKLIRCDDREDNVDWINEIGDAFPNLSSLDLDDMQIMSDSLSVLPVKCCQLTRITFCYCNFTDEDLGIILKGFPGLKYLKLQSIKEDFEECFRELGTNIEHLDLSYINITPAGTSHILSRARKLQTLKIDSGFQCDAHDFSTFCEKAPLRQLSINGTSMSKDAFLSISCFSLLEKLTLIVCPEVDSDVLINISRGCPNLKELGMTELPRVCDRGLGSLAKCRSLTSLSLIYLDAVTDESLIELAKAGTLESLSVFAETITDRGVAAILAQCHHLKFLDVSLCSGVGDSTVDAAIQAVESRRRLSATLEQSAHGSSTAIVPSFKAAKSSEYLLRMYMMGFELNRYKDGISHPLLYLIVI